MIYYRVIMETYANFPRKLLSINAKISSVIDPDILAKATLKSETRKREFYDFHKRTRKDLY
jgi:tRNA(Ser,Leu) C12 N-acetylase TAN1